MFTLLLATKNEGKFREIQSLLQNLDLELVSPQQIHLDIDVQEIGQTYAENAALKGRAYAKASGMLALADDSGLEVDVLGGLPGLHSARLLPQPKATDADRRAHLLAQLKGKPRPWTARFRCVVALAQPDGRTYFSEGVCEGEIIPEERGEHGFGYDPIFYIPEYGRTMAELAMDEKNRISHRARAVSAAVPELIAILQSKEI